MLFGSSSAYSACLLNHLHSCKIWMDLQAEKTHTHTQEHIFRSPYFIWTKMLEIGCWTFLARTERGKLGTTATKKKKKKGKKKKFFPYKTMMLFIYFAYSNFLCLDFRFP